VKLDARIYVAGHRGMVGSALVRRLRAGGFDNLLLRTRQDLDLEVADAVQSFFERERPQYVFLAAARVGGILANSRYPADFLRENLAIQQNVIDLSHLYGVEKLLFLGSSCVYPRNAPQPIREEYLLSGPLESTNRAYAIAKIAGLELCRSYHEQYGCRFLSVMPTNLYGPEDNFDLDNSHVLPALLRKFHDAKLSGASHVEVWGSGTPRREFMHVDDLADACVFLMDRYDEPLPINIGTGSDVSIAELAELIAEVVGFSGALRFDRTKPDGTPRKLLDSTRLRALGWEPRIPLRQGIERTYDWFANSGVFA
jgi:GDP-L-fucose synthase